MSFELSTICGQLVIFVHSVHVGTFFGEELNHRRVSNITGCVKKSTAIGSYYSINVETMSNMEIYRFKIGIYHSLHKRQFKLSFNIEAISRVAAKLRETEPLRFRQQR
eukprot:GILK01000708.1.p2 GENE.GILK01000708.1~~GILK01000708.1.p2  ORF type:complete len:108 (+),score=12.52 GILK01000708.1:277-600(+)